MASFLLPNATRLQLLARVIFIVHTGRGDLKAFQAHPLWQRRSSRLFLKGTRELLGKRVVLAPLEIDLVAENLTIHFTVPHAPYGELDVPKLDVLDVFSDFELVLHRLMERTFDMPLEVRRCLTYFRAE
jgi:hypothetical protein